MTEHKVSPELEDAPDTPVVYHVGRLSYQESSAAPTDPFAADAASLNSLNGTSAVFKRRATNEIKKFQRGQDGVESKQIHEKEYLTGYDTYGVVEPPHNLEHLTKLYQLSSPHYAAVNAKTANIAGLGHRFVETTKTKRKLEKAADDEDKQKKIRAQLISHQDELEDTLDGWNEEDGFTETLIKVWRDYEVTGNGYLEIGRNKDGTIGYLGHIPSKTMRVRRVRDGFVQMSGFTVQFFAHFGAGIDEEKKPRPIANPIGTDRPNEVIHVKKYSPTSGYYGVPDIMAAAQAVAGDKFATDFNLDYFENKAVPRYAVILKGATLSQNAETALLSFFETGLKGQNHRSLYIPLPSDTVDNKVSLDFKAIEAGNQDSSFTNYKKSNRSDILMVHRVPITKISVADGASLAVARDADKTFKEQVCAPEQRIFEKKLNRIIKELTDAYELKLNEMSLTDADTQSKIDERRVKNGIDLRNEVRARDGLPGIPGGNVPVDLNAKGGTAAEQARDSATPRTRDSERSANATDSAGEARNPKGEGRTDGTA